MIQPGSITLVEVGPRDGFQPIKQFVPTATKLEILRLLHKSGIRRIEGTAFVSNEALPQMADAAEIVAASRDLPGLDLQVLVPNAKHAERALAAGARHLSFVLSASEAHNQNNVRRTVRQSTDEFASFVGGLAPDVALRLNIATAFDCPFLGRIAPEQVAQLVGIAVDAAPQVEIALCDTTGRVTADRVSALFELVRKDHPDTGFAFHGHDTYGQGIANVLAALSQGVATIDASAGGLGGCPFAPGATGNVATEDVVWTLGQAGLQTGIDLDLLLEAARAAAALPGAATGGRVRDALTASRIRAEQAL